MLAPGEIPSSDDEDPVGHRGRLALGHETRVPSATDIARDGTHARLPKAPAFLHVHPACEPRCPTWVQALAADCVILGYWATGLLGYWATGFGGSRDRVLWPASAPRDPSPSPSRGLLPLEARDERLEELVDDLLGEVTAEHEL
jgi:hypothetical protein